MARQGTIPWKRSLRNLRTWKRRRMVQTRLLRIWHKRICILGILMAMIPN